MSNAIEIAAVDLGIPNGVEVVLGHATFSIFTVEELHRAVAISAPKARFGIACAEGSDECLVRVTGNDEGLSKTAAEAMMRIRAGHCFLVLLTGAFALQVLAQIKSLPSVVKVHCATGNPLSVIVSETALAHV